MKRLLHIVRDTILFLLVIMLATLVVGMFAPHIDGIITKSGAVSDFGFMAIYFFTMLLVYILTTCYERRAYSLRIPIDNGIRGFDPVTILWGVILLFATSIALRPLSEYLPADERSFNNGEWTLLTTVVLAPIFEEYIFRGRLISLLRHSVSPSVAVLLSSLIFAFSHGVSIVTVSAFVAGILFGYIYILRRSIIAPIILHMCNNAIAYALMVLSYRDEPIEKIIDTSISYTLIYGIAATITLVGIIHIIHTFRCADRASRAVIVASQDIDSEEIASDITIHDDNA